MSDAAIPTLYASTQFRSRLEAKWAAFFDACGWPWWYEPLDLEGWIPDFALGWKPTLVEVKPFFREEQFADVLAKLTASGVREEVVLLGAGPRARTEEDDTNEEPTLLGWLAEWYDHEGCSMEGVPHAGGAWALQDLHIGWTEGNGKLGLCPLMAGWVNVIWEAPKDISHPNKWARVWDWDPYDRERGYLKSPARFGVADKWARACNQTQWMAKV